MDTLVVQRIKNRMESVRLTVSDLEKRAGLSLSSVRNILNGRSKNPSYDTIVAIAKELNCSLDELCYGTLPADEKRDEKEDQHSWSLSTFYECLMFVDEYLHEINYVPNLKEVINMASDIYVYSYTNGGSSIDKRFGQWVINKKIKAA